MINTKLLIILSPFITILIICALIALICIAPFYFFYEGFNALLDFIDKGRLRKAKVKAYELKKQSYGNIF